MKIKQKLCLILAVAVSLSMLHFATMATMAASTLTTGLDDKFEG